MAAMASHLADYNQKRLAELAEGCERLGVPVPLAVATFPRVLADWADTIERTQR